MSAIGNAIKSVADGIGNDIKGVAKGIGEAVEGGVDLAEGALTLNPGKALKGVEQVAGGALSAVSDAASLTPTALAASTLLAGGEAVLQSLPGSSSGA